MTREETVLNYLREHDIPFTNYNHPEGKTIEEAKRVVEDWWQDSQIELEKEDFQGVEFTAREDGGSDE